MFPANRKKILKEDAQSANRDGWAAGWEGNMEEILIL